VIQDRAIVYPNIAGYKLLCFMYLEKIDAKDIQFLEQHHTLIYQKWNLTNLLSRTFAVFGRLGGILRDFVRT
jgi:hypothetical protein